MNNNYGSNCCHRCGWVSCRCKSGIYTGDASAMQSMTSCGGCGGCSGCNPAPPAQSPCHTPKPQVKEVCIEFVQHCRITDVATQEVIEIRASHIEPVKMYFSEHIAQMYIDCGKAQPCGYGNRNCVRGLPGKDGPTKDEIFACLCAAWDDAMIPVVPA